MAGDRTCLHRHQGIAEQRDDDGIEPTSTPEKAKQRSRASFATRLRDRDTASPSTP
jgi:hypothetical protein